MVNFNSKIAIIHFIYSVFVYLKEIGFITSTPSKSPVAKPLSPLTYLKVGTSPSSPSLKTYVTGTGILAKYALLIIHVYF